MQKWCLVEQRSPHHPHDCNQTRKRAEVVSIKHAGYRAYYRITVTVQGQDHGLRHVQTRTHTSMYSMSS